jgi:hypothetical protein
VLPLVIASASQTPPRLTPVGFVIALAATLVLPLVMLGTYFPRGSVSERLHLVVSMVRRHPMAVLASLLILPLSLPAIEVLLFTVTRLSSTFSFLLMDVFPPHDGVRWLSGVPYFAPSEVRLKWIDFRHASDSLILGTYAVALGRGYTLLGTIPASVAMDTSNTAFPGSLGLNLATYLAVRMFFTLVIAACMLGVLAVQARWLGLLSTIDSRRSAASAGSTGLSQLPNLTPETT